MMHINMQIQNIKKQMNNIQFQLEKIESQLINMGISFIGEHLSNLGIQVINNGIQILNIGIPFANNANIINIKQQISLIKMQMQTLEMNIPDIAQIQNMGINNGMINNNFNMEKKSIKIANIIFNSSTGKKKLLHFNYETTINDILERYLVEIGKPEYINTDYISFIFNAQFLKFGDTTKIEKYFCSSLPHPPIITVVEHK